MENYIEKFEKVLKEKNLPDSKTIVEYLERTNEDSWCVDVVKTTDGRNCLYGHLFDLGGNAMFDTFEYLATTFMVYPVNDGLNKDYQQKTAKDRCVAYVKDLLSGKQKTAMQFFDEGY